MACEKKLSVSAAAQVVSLRKWICCFSRNRPVGFCYPLILESPTHVCLCVCPTLPAFCHSGSETISLRASQLVMWYRKPPVMCATIQRVRNKKRLSPGTLIRWSLHIRNTGSLWLKTVKSWWECSVFPFGWVFVCGRNIPVKNSSVSIFKFLWPET